LSRHPDWLWGPVSCLYSMDIGGKECEVHHSTPSTAKVQNEWSYTSTSPYSFMTWTALTSPVLYLHVIHFKHKLYSIMAGFSCYHQGSAFGFHFSDRNLGDALQTCRMGLQGQTQRNMFPMPTFCGSVTYLPAYFSNHHVHYSDYQYYLLLSSNMITIK
jgi:hypothetical protein